MEMKKIMKITLVAAFITIAGYGVYTNQKSESMSDLALSNVEAQKILMALDSIDKFEYQKQVYYA